MTSRESSFFFFLQTWLFFTKKKHLLDLPTITSQSHLTKCFCFHFIVNFTLLYINTCTQIQYKTLISTCCAKHIIILIHKKVTTVTVLTLTQSLKLLHHTHNITPSENKHFATHEFHGELSQAFNMTFSWVIFRWSEFHYMLNETKFYK